MKKNTTPLSILIAAVLIGGALIFVATSGSGTATEENKNNVSMVDGKQIITITAKGGYSPRVTSAQSNVPTVLKVSTLGTFDCSSALTIPSLGYRNNLPSSGETLIDLPPQKPGTTLRGLCAMGMYNFAVNFN
jgi:Cu+-exporting ATPase